MSRAWKGAGQVPGGIHTSPTPALAGGEVVDDDVRIEGGAGITPNDRCPITNVPVRRGGAWAEGHARVCLEGRMRRGPLWARP